MLIDNDDLSDLEEFDNDNDRTLRLMQNDHRSLLKSNRFSI